MSGSVTRRPACGWRGRCDRAPGRAGALKAGDLLSAAELAGAIGAAALRTPRPAIIGITGAQGAGKTTLARAVVERLDAKGVAAERLSLDDFYRTRAEREALARRVHPLCRTRGVPGTHDVALLESVLARLPSATPECPVAMPRFDKLSDDRLPESAWCRVERPPEVTVLEGWCVGLGREAVAEWTGPINALEADDDPDGVWAEWSRAALREYEPVWARLGYLAGLVLPDMESVVRARLLQERTLVEESGGAARAMDEPAVRRFVAHFERHTLALMGALPQVADVVAERGTDFAFRLVSEGSR